MDGVAIPRPICWGREKRGMLPEHQRLGLAHLEIEIGPAVNNGSGFAFVGICPTARVMSAV